MVRRYLRLNAFPKLALRPAAALREVLAKGYSRQDLVADVMAGLVVGVVALPLSMALAIASGVPPQHGLYTAIVAGAVGTRHTDACDRLLTHWHGQGPVHAPGNLRVARSGGRVTIGAADRVD